MKPLERALNSVVFLFADLDDEHGQPQRKPVGTGFLVGYPVGDGHCLYIVTARHVVEGVSRLGRPLIVRYNLQSGAFQDHEGPSDAWVLSPNTDLAAAPIAGQIIEQQTTHTWVPSGVMMDPATAAEYQLGPGDDIFVAAMLGSYVGRNRAEPIIRRGYIASIPTDPVRLTVGPGTHTDARAYLCELTSVGGQSGAPAFVLPPMYRIPGIAVPDGWPVLLGVLQGHYEGKVDGNETETDANTGISVVLPAEDLRTLLEDQLFQEQRRDLVNHAGS